MFRVRYHQQEKGLQWRLSQICYESEPFARAPKSGLPPGLAKLWLPYLLWISLAARAQLPVVASSSPLVVRAVPSEVQEIRALQPMA